MSATATSAVSPLSALDLINSDSAASKVKAKAAAAGSSSTSGAGLDSTTTGTTFLSLLVKELQNQDPTAPMDSTAMVGQMISLNQLDQLISINQVLSTASTSSSSTSNAKVSSASAGGDSASSQALLAARAALANNPSDLTSTNSAALAAGLPSSTLDFSTLNTSFGAK